MAKLTVDVPEEELMLPVHPLEQATINRLDNMVLNPGQYLGSCLPTLTPLVEFENEIKDEEEDDA